MGGILRAPPAPDPLSAVKIGADLSLVCTFFSFAVEKLWIDDSKALLSADGGGGERSEHREKCYYIDGPVKLRSTV